MFNRKLKIALGFVFSITVFSSIIFSQNLVFDKFLSGNYATIENLLTFEKVKTANLLVTRTWDGEGATNNWSEAANWSGDVVPAAGDVAVFDATSIKDATIDVSVTVQSLQINSGYTGTVTQSDTRTLTISGGNLANANFVCGTGGLVTLRSTVFNMDGGTFDCSSGTLNIVESAFNHNNGTLIAPSANLTLKAGEYNQSATAVFNHNNGTIVINNNNLSNSSTNRFNFNGAAAGTLDIFNLTMDTVQPAPNSVFLNISSGDTLRVLGNLNLGDGQVSLGTLEAQGNLNVGGNFDGGNARITFSGAANQTYTNGGGVNPTNIWTINKPGGTLTLNSNLNLSFLSSLALTEGTITTGANIVDAGTSNVTRTNGRIIGNLKRRFTSTGNKLFDVGTINGYAPVAVNVTTLGTNPSEITVGATQGGHPLLNPALALGRFWSITESGNVTATLTFNYLQTDVAGNENSYKVNRIENGQVQILEPPTATVNTTNNTAIVTGVTDFSDWTLSAPPPSPLLINPTNATVDAGGNVQFNATGGTPPFTFSIPANNSGATIDSSTGFYVAGTTAPVTDTVRVTDAANVTANATVNVLNPFLVINTNDSGAGSLRQAILNANTAPGAQTIQFNISGAPPYSIALTSPLPAISDAVIIDGTTQRGFAGTPIVELNGANAGVGANGITVEANNTTVKGLVINRFTAHGILLNADNCAIQGNYIGTSVNGLNALGNGESGLALINADNNNIGGGNAQERNIISRNGLEGIILTSSNNNIIRGNFIGVGANGTTALGNARQGIRIINSNDNRIGGIANGEGNIIANSQRAGILLENGLRQTIKGNSIFANLELGIDLSGNDAPNGVTPNDSCDSDTGTNNLQNYPLLDSAVSAGGNTTIQGTLNSTPNQPFTIDFYSNTQSDPSGFGEGRTLIGSTSVNTNIGCNASFSVALPVTLLAGQFITATATDATGNTSEFSPVQIVTAPCSFSINPASQNFPSNGGNGTVAVTTAQTCGWTAVSNDSFITIVSGSSGTGSGNVNFTVAPNTTGAQRTGTITVAGQTFTVTQDLICNFSINPTAQNFGLTGGTGVVNVQTNPDCAWVAVSNNPFIIINSGNAGNGPGNVNYTVTGAPDANPRSGTMSIAGKAFFVSQSQNLSACSGSTFRKTTVQMFGIQSIADFNRDGIPDLLSAQGNQTAVSLGKGDGTFGSPITSDVVAGSFITNIGTGDFNSDGLLDLAASTFISSGGVFIEIQIGLGNGSGAFNFSVISSQPSNSGTFRVTAGDLNNDGKLDLIRARLGGVYQIFFGNGDGTFAAPQDRSGSVGEIVVSDFNRDGKQDFVSTQVDKIEVFLGVGLGQFSSSASFQPQNTSFGFAVVEDFNRDGIPDIATTDRGNQNSLIKVFLGTGNGGFNSPQSSQTVSGGGAVQAGDLNRDGKLDLVYTTTSPSNFSILHGDGTGKFSMPIGGFGVTVAFPIPVLGDFNQDGKTDIAINSGSQGTTILLNSCGGLTQKPKIDFDGDGKTDFAVFRPGEGVWYIFRSSDLTAQIVQWGLSGDKPAAGDFDGDGKTDLAVFRPSNGQWFILKSSDATVIIVQFGLSEDQPAVGDYDGDGKADIAVFRPSSGLWFVLKSSDGTAVTFQWGIGSDIIIQ